MSPPPQNPNPLASYHALSNQIANNYSDVKLRVSGNVMRNIKMYISKTQKIMAIKELRSATKCSLAEAKFAVERMADPNQIGPSVVPLVDIKSVTVTTGEGDVTVDLEGLQLMGLMHTTAVSIDTCRSILKLVDILEAWKNDPWVNGPDTGTGSRQP